MLSSQIHQFDMLGFSFPWFIEDWLFLSSFKDPEFNCDITSIINFQNYFQQIWKTCSNFHYLFSFNYSRQRPSNKVLLNCKVCKNCKYLLELFPTMYCMITDNKSSWMVKTITGPSLAILCWISWSSELLQHFYQFDKLKQMNQ